VWANQSDLRKIEEILNKNNSKKLAGLTFDTEQINQVFDTSKKTATCPACGTTFPTTDSECPDCGLIFG
jgi:rRNA maturation endonuclease Nob1